MSLKKICRIRWQNILQIHSHRKCSGKSRQLFNAAFDKGDRRRSLADGNSNTHKKTEEFIADDETAELLPLAKSKKQNYILTVTSRSVETFDGNKVDDYSRPTNSYLPKGTVDSCSPYRIYDSESKKKYYLLSSGIRVYSKKGVKISKGTVKKKIQP